MTTPDTILECQHLRKEFGGLVAVNNVSLRVQRGSVHSIIGPNGAGKTTLMNLISGIYKPTHGAVRYNGRDITALPLHQRAHIGIGRSFQITNIFPNLTVLENARLAAQARGKVNFNILGRALAYREYIQQAVSVLEEVGLRDDLHRLASALPHGGKRKLELAILLAGTPELLILDEPTAGVASEQVQEMIGNIGAIRAQHNRTIIIVEHNMHLVMNVSDRITVMHLGAVLAEGTPSEIAANRTVQSAYLGELYADVMQPSEKDEKHD